MGPTPFDEFHINKGKSRNIAKQEFDNVDPEALKIPTVGKFKGLIKVGSRTLMASLEMLRDSKINKMIKGLKDIHEQIHGDECDINFDELDKIDEKKKI